ncbi:MAG: hypothetical protein M0Z47_05105 [Actinomycetota bacterium]|nr:hypothetical protein [Actinomycetota bacterium]
MLWRVGPCILAAEHDRWAQDDRIAIHFDLNFGLTLKAKAAAHFDR